jgi:indole-3-glycerol phosphate synthase
MPVSLQEIIAATRHRLAEAQRTASVHELERLAAAQVPRGFRRALQRKSENGTAIIAELKKASPSRGLIRADFQVQSLAAGFEQAGAAALSVLTDEKFFQGSLADLQLASQSTSLPCLRKDFMIDEFQVLEAKASRADAILLIVAALTDSELTRLRARATELELDVLCEVHDADELRRAADLGFDLIGVNNRDLRTFHVDLNTALHLADLFPQNALRVAESGIHTEQDLAALRAAGYRAFLIGESLMKASSPGGALQELVTEHPKAVVVK